MLVSLKSLFYKLASLGEDPILAGLLGLLVYSAYAIHVNPDLEASNVNFYSYLADAFLHGQLSLNTIPPGTHDLVYFNNQYFLYWPPMPALMFVPYVALFGIGFNDIIFTLPFAALNITLVALILRKVNKDGIVTVTPFQRSILVVFFAFGTVHFTVAPYGRVWFTGQVIGFFFMALAYLTAISLSGRAAFFLTGLAVACAFMSRNTILFAALWPAIFLISRNWHLGWRPLLRRALSGMIPVLLMGIVYLAYNWLRFGTPLETGIQYQLMAPELLEHYEQYGMFNSHYLKTNFYYHYIYYPFPETGETLMGGSLFLLSPVFLLAFISIAKGKPRFLVSCLLITILAVDLPILLFNGTGWFQFGPRYTLDFTLPLLLLTAIGLRWVPDWLLFVLSSISIAHFYKGMSILNMVWRI